MSASPFRVRFIVPLVALVGMLIAPLAHAYILPAEYLLEQLAAQRRELRVRDLSVHLETRLEAEQDDVHYERLFVKGPERLRLVTSEAADAYVYVQREGRSAEGTAAHLKMRGHASLFPFVDLLLPEGSNTDTMRNRLIQRLDDWHVKRDTVSLARRDGRIVYIIGAQPWDEQANQVWLDKETLLPRYLSYWVHKGSVVSAEAAGRRAKRWEFRLSDYGSDEERPWFPRRFEISVDGASLRRSDVTQIARNQNLPETLFGLPNS